MSDCEGNNHPRSDDDYDESRLKESSLGYEDRYDEIGDGSVNTDYMGYNERSNDNNNASYDRKPHNEVKRSSNFGLQDNCDVCLICDAKVYPMDKLNADGKLYHKNCFRCSKCRTILSITNFTVNNNSIYCKTHFMELFKMRGKFADDENIQHEIITGTDSEEIPTTDTKGLLAKFRELESGGGSTPQPSYIVRRSSSTNQRYVQATDDIVKCDDLAPDELPPPETAKAMVAKFKAMESNQNVPSPVCVEKMQLKAKANSTPNANVRLQMGNHQASINEDDYNKEEMPEEGSTKTLMNKFQNLSECNEPRD